MDIYRVFDADADYLLFVSTVSNAGAILQPYIEKLTHEQLKYLIDIVRIYSNICKMRDTKAFSVKELLSFKHDKLQKAHKGTVPLYRTVPLYYMC